MKKINLLRVFLMNLFLVFCLSLPLSVAADNEQIYITYEEYIEAIRNEYLKYDGGDQVIITDPENVDELVITMDDLERQLSIIRYQCGGRQIQENQISEKENVKSFSKETENSVSPWNMPYESTAVFNKTAISQGAVPGSADFKVTINYYGNAQYGTVTGIKSGSVIQLGTSMNLSNWQDYGYTVVSLGKTARVDYNVYVTFTQSGAFGETYSHAQITTFNCYING